MTENFQTFSPETIKSHFSETFGVDVKFHEGLYLFKYDMIDVKWNEMVEECRGIILGYQDGWKVVSHPFDKFYNFSESRCHVKEFEKDDEFIIKADGTCIQLYYDFINDKWRISTLGTIVTIGWNSSETFEEMFLRITGLKFDNLDKTYCHIFELCAEANQVVNKYETDRVYYLKSRNIETDELVDRFSDFSQFSIMRPERFDFSGLTKEQILEAIELFGIDYGAVPEGVVVYRGGRPSAKLKRIDYLSKHAIFTGDKRHIAKNLVQQFFENKVDDYYSLLPIVSKKFIDKLSEMVNCWKIESEKIHPQFINIVDKKEFVEKIKQTDSLVAKKFNCFFFTKWTEWISGELKLVDWLRMKNYGRPGNYSQQFRYNFEFLLSELKDIYET